MSKKEYKHPNITPLGKIHDITLGKGGTGSDGKSQARGRS